MNFQIKLLAIAQNETKKVENSIFHHAEQVKLACRQWNGFNFRSVQLQQ